MVIKEKACKNCIHSGICKASDLYDKAFQSIEDFYFSGEEGKIAASIFVAEIRCERFIKKENPIAFRK